MRWDSIARVVEMNCCRFWSLLLVWLAAPFLTLETVGLTLSEPSIRLTRVQSQSQLLSSMQAATQSLQVPCHLSSLL